MKEIVGLQREERLEISYEALREALTNCLCHRQFEKYSLTPSIAIYDDRIEIDNPGVLPQASPVQSIKASHQSFPYNPIMADVLYKTTFLERWGSGIERILRACHENDVEEPEWSFDGAFVRITFKRILVRNEQINEQKELSDRQKLILDIIRANPTITFAEMTNKVGCSTSTIQREFAALSKLGIKVERAGSKKDGHWDIIG